MQEILYQMNDEQIQKLKDSQIEFMKKDGQSVLTEFMEINSQYILPTKEIDRVSVYRVISQQKRQIAELQKQQQKDYGFTTSLANIINQQNVRIEKLQTNFENIVKVLQHMTEQEDQRYSNISSKIEETLEKELCWLFEQKKFAFPD